jgi:protocatechuate 3,4-dioxygenase beta subunit
VRDLRRAEREAAQPQLLYPPYRSSIRRAPLQPLITVPDHLANLAAPVYGLLPIGDADHDLTRQHAAEPLGQRIIVAGRVLDDRGRPVPHTLVEIWQCNAGGRYAHAVDDHPAPLDPNFTGAGRTLTDSEGRYHFVTIKPGA